MHNKTPIFFLSLSGIGDTIIVLIRESIMVSITGIFNLWSDLFVDHC
jgi:hypothetical protein